MERKMMNDEEMMLRVLRLALKGTGFVSPNPRVGAVITKDDIIIGEGWHKKYGSDHAEIDAMKNSGLDDFTDCTLYVNLEPCSHEGKTPACAPVIVSKGFSRVVIGMQDPNPLVSGAGIEILEAAGIEVNVGVMENQCRWINRFFIKHITTKIPYVILKAAVSLDACIATKEGESQWITGSESRKKSHAIRAEVDAVIVGKTTALKDNPRLTVREKVGVDPKKVIFDTNLELPLELEVYKNTERAKTIVCCSEKAATTRKADSLRLAGVSICETALDETGRLSPEDALVKLSERYSISSVLVEGGAKLFSSFIRSNSVDELNIFYAPLIMGDGIRVFSEFKTKRLKDAFPLRTLSISKSGPDTHIILLNENNYES